MKGVVPEHRFSHRENALYLNSCAGMIKFTSRDYVEMDRFRNNYLNRFVRLDPKSTRDFFHLYKEVFDARWSRKSRIKYVANFRTRLRMKIAS